MNNFVRGLKDEFLGMACRDGVEAVNLENILFGTIGHIALGVGGAALVMGIANIKGPKVITGKVIPMITGKKE